MKDNSRSYAVFTEQGSSASQLTAEKVMDFQDVQDKELNAVSTKTQGQNGRCSNVVENSKVRVSRYSDTSTATQVANILVQH